MKKFLIMGFSLVIVGFICIIFKINSYAAKANQNTLVHINASVPDDMDSEVKITFESSTDNIIMAIPLLKEKDYSEDIHLSSGTTYMTIVSINSEEKWIVDAQESYDIPNEDEFTISFSIQKPNEEKDNVNDVSSDNNDEIQLFESSIEENQEFLSLVDAISVIANVEEYQLDIDIAKRKHDKYLEANKENTEERWENMTDFEKYVYYTTYLTPYMYLRLNSSDVGSSRYSLTDFLYDVEEGCRIATAKRNNYPYCDRVKDAFDKYYEYVYNRFAQTRTIYDFLNEGSGHLEIKAHDDIVIDEEPKKDIDPSLPSEELESSQEGITQDLPSVELEDQKPNKISRLIDALKKSSLSIILLIIVGGAYLIVKNYNKRKNIYDNEK